MAGSHRYTGRRPLTEQQGSESVESLPVICRRRVEQLLMCRLLYLTKSHVPRRWSAQTRSCPMRVIWSDTFPVLLYQEAGISIAGKPAMATWPV
jgi:hypothetical protein